MRPQPSARAGNETTPQDDSTPDPDQWVRRLTRVLQILDLTPDTQELLDLASQVSGAVSPEAGPLTTFCVGYAAALDAAGSRVGKTPEEVVRVAVSTAPRIADEGAHGGPDRVGWAAIGQ